MKNFNLLNDTTIQLSCGVFAGVTSYSTYANGELAGIRLSEKNMLVTHAGELVPAYTSTHRRKTKFSVEFHKNGMIKAVSLNEQQEIQTPIGEFPAELVTFFDTGELNRFFPLDGQISGLWSEEEEKTLAIPLTFDLPFTHFSSIINGVAFYKSGNIRSVTLFPGETIIVQTSYGEIPVRIGFSLYESGGLESTETASPVQMKTPIGMISAFDPNATGINADKNSLVFNPSGKMISLTTAGNRIALQTADGRMMFFTPREVINPLDDETMMTEGLIMAFNYDEDTVSFESNMEKSVFCVSESAFTITPYKNEAQMCNPEDCANCSMGCKDASISAV